ncbi:MAG: type II secretion system protein M [Spirochaetota bacterium]|nr:MAG: type II secretion system protein M [Spirochaetota bacterium]
MDMRNLFRRVSNREKILIFVTSVLLVAFLVYQFVFVPLMGVRREYDLEWMTLEKRFHELEALAQRYADEKSYLNALIKTFDTKKGISVLTFLENIAEDVGIRENIEYIKPRGSETKDGITRTTVELKIDAISIVDLMRFLYRIEEDRRGVTVSYLRLKPYFKNREKSDVIFRITDVDIE